MAVDAGSGGFAVRVARYLLLVVACLSKFPCRQKKRQIKERKELIISHSLSERGRNHGNVP